MSTVTKEDYAKIDEPCKSCRDGLFAIGSGRNKEIYCKKKSAKLMGGGNMNWYQIIDCPLKKN
jgi:hypothetical protein